MAMNAEAMSPFGAALSAFFGGEQDAELLLCRDDGLVVPLPMTAFFRARGEFSEIEAAALDACTGHVLDGGAGSGLHTLPLQERGLPVTAVDVSRAAIAVMSERGVLDARQADLTVFNGGLFDTLLLLGHGVGMVEHLDGLDRFLKHAQTLVSPSGKLLIHSTDVRMTDESVHLAYHDRNRQAGRYIGVSRLYLEFKSESGTSYDWLLVEPDTLREHAATAGWDCEILRQETTGEYLAQLRQRQS